MTELAHTNCAYNVCGDEMHGTVAHPASCITTDCRISLLANHSNNIIIISRLL